MSRSPLWLGASLAHQSSAPPHQAIDGKKVKFGVTFSPCPSSSARRHGAEFNYTSRPYKTQVTERQCIVLSLGQGLKQGGLVSLQPAALFARLETWNIRHQPWGPGPCKCTFREFSTVSPVSDSDVAGFFGAGCSAVQELTMGKAARSLLRRGAPLNRVVEHPPC